jgi:type I restriction enzyme, S subunit
LKSRTIQEFKKTEVGKIPTDWDVENFETNLKIKGRIGWKGYKTTDLRDSGPIVLGGNNIKSSFFLDLSKIKYLSKEKFDESPEIKLEKNDILLVTRGNLGDVSFFNGEIVDATINPSVVILSEFKGNSLFLFYYLLSNSGKKNILSLTSGTSVPAIYQSSLKKIKFPNPPIIEQNKISNFINKFDLQINSLKKQNNVLEQISQSIFKSWFVDFDGVTEFDDSELGQIPKGWNVTTLREFVDYLVGFPFKSKDYFEGKNGIKLVRGDNVKRQKLVWGIKTRLWKEVTPKIEKFLIKENDILIGMDGSRVGDNFAIVYNYELPLLLVQRVARLSSKNKFYGEFIWQLIKNGLFTNYVKNIHTGSAIPHISKEQILDFSILSPSENLIKKFHNITNPIRKKISQNNSEMVKLEKTRDILLPKLMSGEIKV